ncbi:alpha/beta hydrolase family protein [[Mycobacterium] zoologicum]|uniref:alpha/beta hydrolase family protein n=1 Tax=[Mycobacterium] zoologicum TaxID=2872311 RepID=UPI001CDAF209|nr:alpha/beta fold hydrolase [Mycolicibacter sp. MYC101]MEB3065353.1 alpha/beta fold hydrolase [Mycolicibacter sp. MYC101]
MTSDANPINPPLPVPDVPSADADERGLPDRSELSLREKMIVDTSAFADLGLRTMVASLVAAAMMPAVVTTVAGRGQSYLEREQLQFYAELAALRDPARSFPAPAALPRISSRRANPLAERIARGTVENVSFTSGFEAVNPAMRDTWRALSRNNTARFQHWRHDDGPRPTLCVIHGFMGSPYLFNGLFFSLPWFFRSGYDVVLFTLPFHGRRAEKHSPFSGFGYFSHGMSGFAEAMAQAVHDFRSVVDYLEFTGVDRVALTGLSLGGYTSALLAAVEPRLQAVIPNVPVVSVESEIRDWFPANLLLHAGQRMGRIPHDEFATSTAFHSPLNYPPLVAKDRRLIITGLGDRLAPPEQAEMLWEHWDHCALHWFPGNHVLHVSQPAYLRRMTAFLREYMF